MSRDPIEEHGGKGLYGFALNDSVGRHDRLGLEIGPPPPELGFTLADVHNAVITAIQCGVKGPGGKRLSEMYAEMIRSPEPVSWGPLDKHQGQKGPATDVLPGCKSPRITFNKCNPRSGKKDIPGTDQNYYFEAAIIHELIHAYGHMTGAADDEGSYEEEAVKAGHIVNQCLNACYNQ